MKNLFLITVAAGSLVSLSATAQRIVDRDVKYEYQRLPLTPLDKSIKTFQVKVLAPYEAENDKAQQEFQRATTNLDSDFAAAQAAHAKAVSR